MNLAGFVHFVSLYLGRADDRGSPSASTPPVKAWGYPASPRGWMGQSPRACGANGEYHKVLDYVSWDVKNTLGVAEAVETAGHLNWTSRKGRPNSWPCSKWLTAKEAMALPEPDTSWMDDPWKRSKFYGWTGYEPELRIVAGEHYKEGNR